MKVRKARAALLSDFEVLQYMQDLDVKRKAGHAAAAAAAPTITSSETVVMEDQHGRIDQEDDTSLDSAVLPGNLRLIQHSLLETLTLVQRPCAHQSEAQINSFLDAISAWERGREVAVLPERRSSAPILKEKRLTKGEKLMLVNYAPTSHVALYAIVEELAERLIQEEQDDLLDIISLTLPLDQIALQQAKELEEIKSGNQAYYENDVHFDEAIGEEVYVGQGEEGEDEAIVEDMNELENEGRGEGAVDDEPKDDE